jgi:hypothetical protein
MKEEENMRMEKQNFIVLRLRIRICFGCTNVLIMSRSKQFTKPEQIPVSAALNQQECIGTSRTGWVSVTD